MFRLLNVLLVVVLMMAGCPFQLSSPQPKLGKDHTIAITSVDDLKVSLSLSKSEAEVGETVHVKAKITGTHADTAKVTWEPTDHLKEHDNNREADLVVPEKDCDHEINVKVTVELGHQKKVGESTLVVSGKSCLFTKTINGLDSNRLSKLAVDSDGGLWVGTQDAGLFHYADTKWTHLPESPKGLFGKFVRLLEVSQDGGIWTVSRGIVRNSDIQRFKKDHDWTTCAWPAEWYQYYTALTANPSKDLLLAARVGTIGNEHELIPIEPLAQGDDCIEKQAVKVAHAVTALALSAEGKAWFGFQRPFGFGTLDQGASEPTYYKFESANINSIAIDHKGTAWMATSDGLVQVEPGHEKSPDVHRNILPGFNNLTKVLFDSQKHLWVGSTNGLGRLELGKWVDVSKHLPSKNVIDIAYDAKNSYLWVATDKGLVRLRLGR